jgi:tripartite-type tricarboxylate transporter receptor subunit TctC
MNTSGILRRRLLLCAAAGWAPLAWAQAGKNYPEHPIRLVVGFVPGGPNDLMARILAAQLGTQLGQTVIVENKPGAGGVIGSDFVAKAAPDGYTLLFASAPFVMAPAVQARMPFDTLKDFAPITKVAESPMVLLVGAGSKFRTARDLIEFAKQNPGKVNYGSGGVGSTPHLTTEYLSTLTGAKFTHIPYKGGGDSLKALQGGEIDMLIDSITSMGGALQSGRVRALAISAKERSPKLPQVPTFAEAGVQGFQMTHWVGLLAPANVPAAVLAQLREQSVKAVRSPLVVQKLNELGQFIQAELARWKAVAKTAHISVQ